MKTILTQKQEAYINATASGGRYAGVSDVVRNALRALEQRDDDESPRLEAAILGGIRGPHKRYGRPTLARILNDVPRRGN